MVKGKGDLADLAYIYLYHPSTITLFHPDGRYLKKDASPRRCSAPFIFSYLSLKPGHSSSYSSGWLSTARILKRHHSRETYSTKRVELHPKNLTVLQLEKMRHNILDQVGGGEEEEEEEEKTRNENNSSSSKGNSRKRVGQLDPKTGHWSSVWWKTRTVPTTMESRLNVSGEPLNRGTIRDIDGKLCGIDLHGNVDVPPLNKGISRTVRKKPVGISPTESGVRPLSFERPISVASVASLEKPATPYHPESLQTFNSLSTGLGRSSSAISDTSSIYSVSTVHEAKVPFVYRQKRTVPDLKINTSICTFYPSDDQNIENSSSDPRTPTANCSFTWDRQTLSYRGIICGIDRYGNSIYRDALPGESAYDSCGSSETTKRDSMSTKGTIKTLINTNPSTPTSYRSGYVLKPLIKPRALTPKPAPPPTMLEIRNQFRRGMPADDALSTITSLTTRRLEEDIMSHLEGESAYSYSPGINSTRRIRYDGENGEISSRTEDNSNSNSEKESGNNGVIESWRSGISLPNAQAQVAITNPSDSPTLQIPRFDRRRSSDDGASNLGGSLIGALEPQHTGLKRLSISRRRLDRRPGYEASEIGGLSVKNERDEQEIRSLKAEVEAARSKTLSFQTILQRTSQRFVDAQNQNEELQRQIADLRDHQKLLYDALTSSNESQDNSPYASKNPEGSRNGEVIEGVAEMTYSESINDVVEENIRLKRQVKSLARELAGREEEVRLLIEEMGKQRDIYHVAERAITENRKDERKNQQTVTDKSASRMADKLKWWRRFLLG
ncbi:hypothetical protein TWF506_003244 [Arthrobotrys conoides]|uniref:Uncharacterized protein n=1 Tax=Arthrobotrys conoides TaxID=74498 RepID=A0AAN8NCF6_9PEZI